MTLNANLTLNVQNGTNYSGKTAKYFVSNLYDHFNNTFFTLLMFFCETVLIICDSFKHQTNPMSKAALKVACDFQT